MYDESLMADLMARMVRVRPHKFGITIREYAEAAGCTNKPAQQRLDHLVTNEGWKCEKMKDNGRISMVYWKE